MTELRAGSLAAVWRPDVGMVGTSLTHEGGELLGQRGGLEAYRERGSAFGIPLLAPWANRLSGLSYPSSHGPVTLHPARVKRDGHGLPKDGVMAGREWTVEHATSDWLVASFEADEPVLAVFPFPHALRVSVRLAPDRMEVTTSLSATGDVAVPRCFGWHPLFTLPGVAREDLHVTLPVVRESPLDERGLPAGRPRPARWDDGPLGDRTLDAEYPVIDGSFVLRGGGRRLAVRFGSPEYPVGHAWAPAGESFVAWEPMTAPTNALVSGDGLEFVAPGATTSCTFVVEVTTD